MSPSGVPVLLSTNKNTFTLNKDALTDLLMQEKVKDRYVCIVTVAGAFRTGKSFLLDFFIRYLKQTYEKHSVTRDWLGHEDEELLGFSWRYGSERETIGILMWSDIFLYDHPNGDKIAIILMDTQGTFDNESTLMENATVFGLGTMMSSVMIYNIKNQLDESYLQHLQLFTEYGRLALDASNEKPFQKLLFLLRDWNFPEEAAYGCEGGEQVLSKYLRISDKQPSELQTVRKHIKSCFTKVNCFLLPHPGKNVGRKAFVGCLKDLDEDFKQSLRALVPSILAPENLIPKTMNGERIQVQNLIPNLEAYMSVFNSNELPSPQTILMATAEANYRISINISKKIYTNDMMDIGRTCYFSTTELEAKHVKASNLAIAHFSQQKKMCGDDFFKKYRDILLEDIQEIYNSIKERNEGKKKNAEISLKLAVTKAHEMSKEQMQKVSNITKTHLVSAKLEQHHLSAKKEALTELNFQFKVHGSAHVEQHAVHLNAQRETDNKIRDMENKFQQLQDNRLRDMENKYVDLSKEVDNQKKNKATKADDADIAKLSFGVKVQLPYSWVKKLWP